VRLEAGIAALTALDPALFGRCLALGSPLAPRFRDPGFPTLLQIIIEQQVSTLAADAMWRRLRGRLDPVTPAAFLMLDEAELRACGFSRQKAGYGRGLAEAVAEGRLDLDGIHALPDEEAIAELVRIKGIGRWSAEIYLLAALGRPDIWPVDDLALALGAQSLLALPDRPPRATLIAHADPWRPHRSAAARLIWHWYVATRAGLRTVPKPPPEGIDGPDAQRD